MSDESVTNEVILLINELDILKDKLLQEQAMIFKNYHLLNDCKITPAFINLEKRKAGYCNIVTSDNTPVYTSNPPEIRAGVASFYKGVYGKQLVTATKNNIEQFLTADIDIDPINKLKSRRIPDSLKKEIEGNLTKEELTQALFHNMKPHSAPGIDGFSVAFVRNFWTSLDDLVWLSINNMKAKGKLSSTFKAAILKLLRKGDKDSTQAGNFCPISLLSVFYKIASSAISNRIKKMLTHIIGKQQKAYLPHDNIGSVLLNILGMIEQSNDDNTAGLILLIDF